MKSFGTKAHVSSAQGSTTLGLLRVASGRIIVGASYAYQPRISKIYPRVESLQLNPCDTRAERDNPRAAFLPELLNGLDSRG